MFPFPSVFHEDCGLSAIIWNKTLNLKPYKHCHPD
jgi:hypothetical protein